jgi:integrase
VARLTERLTARTAQTTAKPGMYPDGNGLYLRIGDSGSKSWILRYRSGGRRHDLGLGPYPLIGLAAARERANAQRLLKLDGIDPLAKRLASRAATAKVMTFKQVAEAFIADRRAGWHDPQNEKTWRQSLTDYAYSVIGDMPVDQIDTAAVLRVIKPHWEAHTETMSRVRGRIEAILGYAKTCGYRTGDNPAVWKNHISNILPHRSRVQPAKRHAALPYAEIASFMTDVRSLDRVEAGALEFAILTAARTGEVLGAKWNEIDVEARVWVIPRERMKAGREHRVLLSDRALAILAALPQDGDFVFAKQGRQLKNIALHRLLTRRMGRPDLTVHGFRSTFKDWATEHEYRREIVEIALAHANGDRVEAAYARSDLLNLRRRLADDWADWCNGTTGTIGTKVVKLRA